MRFGAATTYTTAASFAVEVGKFHTCALRSDNRVVCWGRNSNGQLGLSSNTSSVGSAAGQMGTKLQSVEPGDGERAKERDWAKGHANHTHYHHHACKRDPGKIFKHLDRIGKISLLILRMYLQDTKRLLSPCTLEAITVAPYDGTGELTAGASTPMGNWESEAWLTPMTTGRPWISEVQSF